jgi:4-hydroxythreonine-4-phosphate dehydrogenase
MAKVLAARTFDTPITLIGARWALEKGAAAAGVELPEIPAVATADLQTTPIALIDVAESLPAATETQFEFGKVDAGCGLLAVRSVECAAEHCMAGQVSAMVTCPINKEAVHAAGFVDDIGHQEILSRLTAATRTATMLMTPGLRVVHLSTHKSLIEAARFVTRANVLDKLKLTHDSLERWGLPQARIAVAALNPHGGEGGLLGREEIDEIVPAVADAKSAGIDVTGPVPADSVFNRAINGEFDVVLALYHDQGHIAIKVHDFHKSTTATLGIPFIRTSVDHGTAFDIAGRGIADESGLLAAIAAAQVLVAGQLARL